MKSKNKYTELPLWEKLKNKVLIYYQTVWAEKRLNSSHYKGWLNNYSEEEEPYSERLNSLYLLTKFMYFGQDEIRELLLSIYRDKYKYRIVEGIRRVNNDTIDLDLITKRFNEELDKTRFIGLGEASESGSFLLYYFRQVNKLPTGYLKYSSEIMKDGQIAEPLITRYVFLDDFCGSGETGIKCKGIIDGLKQVNEFIEVSYYVLFATEEGIRNVKDFGNFDCVETVFKLDSSFKCFEGKSRYYTENYEGVDKDFAKNYVTNYGSILTVGTPIEGHPLGFNDGQLLLGFSHNTPDNTLPIVWSDNNWEPSFIRYIKNQNADGKSVK